MLKKKKMIKKSKFFFRKSYQNTLELQIIYENALAINYGANSFQNGLASENPFFRSNGCNSN